MAAAGAAAICIVSSQCNIAGRILFISRAGAGILRLALFARLGDACCQGTSQDTAATLVLNSLINLQPLADDCSKDTIVFFLFAYTGIRASIAADLLAVAISALLLQNLILLVQLFDEILISSSIQLTILHQGYHLAHFFWYCTYSFLIIIRMNLGAINGGSYIVLYGVGSYSPIGIEICLLAFSNANGGSQANLIQLEGYLVGNLICIGFFTAEGTSLDLSSNIIGELVDGYTHTCSYSTLGFLIAESASQLGISCYSLVGYGEPIYSLIQLWFSRFPIFLICLSFRLVGRCIYLAVLNGGLDGGIYIVCLPRCHGIEAIDSFLACAYGFAGSPY